MHDVCEGSEVQQMRYAAVLMLSDLFFKVLIAELVFVVLFAIAAGLYGDPPHWLWRLVRRIKKESQKSGGDCFGGPR